MPRIQDNDVLIRVIKEEFPGISDEGVTAIMGNVDLETGGGRNTVENAWPISKMFEKKDGKYSNNVPSMRKNMVKLGYTTKDGTLTEKGKEYQSLTNTQKLGAMYEGDTDSIAGGFGPLQLTLGKAAGGKEREDQIKKLMVYQNYE